MLLQEYIEVLKRRLEEVGNLPVAITQSGYYAEGCFADFNDNPELKEIIISDNGLWIDGKYVLGEVERREFLVLGHSHQTY